MPRKDIYSFAVFFFVAAASALNAQEDGQNAVTDVLELVCSGQQALQLLETKLVQAELKLTPSQKKELAPLLGRYNKALQESEERSRGGEPEDQRGFNEEFDLRNRRTIATIKKILLPQQFRRLGEIGVQACGPALFEPGYGRELELFGFSAEQEKEIDKILEDRSVRIEELVVREKLDIPQDPEVFIESWRRIAGQERAIEEEAMKKIMGVLTPKQRSKVAEWSGKKIDVGKLNLECRETLGSQTPM